MFIRILPTTLLQIFCVNLLYFQVILKSMKIADDTFLGNSECEWVKNQTRKLRFENSCFILKMLSLGIHTTGQFRWPICLMCCHCLDSISQNPGSHVRELPLTIMEFSGAFQIHQCFFSAILKPIAN